MTASAEHHRYQGHGSRRPAAPAGRPPRLQLQRPWRQAYHRLVKNHYPLFVARARARDVADPAGEPAPAGQNRRRLRRAGGSPLVGRSARAHRRACCSSTSTKSRLAGAVALVLRDGKPVYERAVGWSDKEAGRRMAPDTIFRIASQTKAITSVAILALVEEGKLGAHRSGRAASSRRSRRRRWRSQRRDGAAPRSCRRSAPITIRDLLTHTAGISYGTDRRRRRAVRGEGARARRPATAGTPPTRTSRSATRWSGSARCRSSRSPARRGSTATTPTSSAASSRRRRGMPLDEFIRDAHHRRRSGMKDTQFFLPPAQRDRLAAVYASGADGKIVRAPDGAARAGALRRRSAQELRRRRGPAVDGARLRAVPRDDPQRRRARRRAHPRRRARSR